MNRTNYLLAASCVIGLYAIYHWCTGQLFQAGIAIALCAAGGILAHISTLIDEHRREQAYRYRQQVWARREMEASL